MSEKFTPGPWMVGGARAKIERHDTHSIIRYDDAKKRDETIASVWYDPKTDLGRADAHLIAAAPDLYAALVDAREAIIHLVSACGGEAEGFDGDWVAEIDAALAKARGQ